MHDLIHQLLEAHVDHELHRFKTGNYKQAIDEEVSAAFEWIKTIKLKEVMTAEQILGIIRRNVVELPVAGGITELTGEMSRMVLASRQNRKTAMEEIFARKQYDDIVDKIVSMEDARKGLIHRLVNSSAYSRQISEVMYNGIKEYILSENIVVKKVPGLSSLIKAGTFAVHKTMHSLEVAMENRIKTFIQGNLEYTLKNSERSLNSYFNNDRIVDMSEEIWAATAQTRLSEYFNTIDADDMEDFIVIGYDFWMHFRGTPYFKGIYTELVKYFFKKYGDRELDILLEEVGVTREMVIQELIAALSPGIEKALSTGYLEERIRTRLKSFYFSPEAASLLSHKQALQKQVSPEQASSRKTRKKKPQITEN